MTGQGIRFLCRIAHFARNVGESLTFDTIRLSGKMEVHNMQSEQFRSAILSPLVGTYAFAGSGREDSVDRLQSSVDVLHAIYGDPGQRHPGRSFEPLKMHPRSAQFDQRGLHLWG
jgi:hypothetical protein